MRNLWISKQNDASPNADRFFQLPKVAANSNAATVSSANDGSLYWDDENNKLYCCKGGAWKEVTVAS